MELERRVARQRRNDAASGEPEWLGGPDRAASGGTVRGHADGPPGAVAITARAPEPPIPRAKLARSTVAEPTSENPETSEAIVPDGSKNGGEQGGTDRRSARTGG